jgi:hypothetical protein
MDGMIRYLKFAGLTLAVALLAACVSIYETAFDAQLNPAVSRGWNVTDVQVTVPAELVVSEERSLVPDADIVWREGPPGDRKAQIATILRDAVMRGAAPLNGPTPVRILIEVTRFHALTFEAETRLSNAGVHNVNFIVTVVDARSGAVLVGPEDIQAETPAFAGAEAVRARLAGRTQKSVITNHVAETIAAWLGIGPDNRRTFSRLGD